MKSICLSREQIHRGALILVNPAHGLVPPETVSLYPACDREPEVLMERQAAVLLNGLMEAMDGWKHIAPVSGWRSQAEQQKIWDDTLAESGEAFTRKYVAVPGHSEHQTGLAIDLGLRQEHIDFICPDFPYEGICQTFRLRAREYGFIERYPAGREKVTGIGHEPWHFRYVGVPHAQIMAEKGWTLEEYIDYLRDYPYGRKSLLYENGDRTVEIAFLKAEAGETVVQVEPEAPCSVSGNNVDGFIITTWRRSHADDRTTGNA